MDNSNGKYDPLEFLVPPYDSNGRSTDLRVRIAVSLSYAIDSVMRSGRFPFITKVDLIRWCIYKGLESLQSMDGACLRVMPLLKIMVLVFRAQARLKNFQEFFAELDSVVLELSKSRFQVHSARRLVKAVQEAVLCIPSGHQRSWFLRELRRRWGHLLTSHVEKSAVATTDDIDV